MVLRKRIRNKNTAALITENKVITDKNTECVDRTPVIIEASSGRLFLKPIILVEDGVAKATKYRLRRTRKGMLRLE